MRELSDERRIRQQFSAYNLEQGKYVEQLQRREQQCVIIEYHSQQHRHGSLPNNDEGCFMLPYEKERARF